MTASSSSEFGLIKQLQTKFPDRLYGFRVSALIECLSFLLAVTALNYIFSDGSRFFSFHPHPYWIIILLIVVQYGTHEALICSLLASVFLLAWNLPEQAISEDIFDYTIKVSSRPFLWLIASVVLGELRLKHIKEKQRLEKEVELITERESAISSAYLHLKEIKENLETRIAGQLQGSVTTYQALKSIESLSPIQILMGLGDMVSAVLNPGKYSVYSFGENGFEVISSEGWEEDDGFSRRIGKESPLYGEMMGAGRVLCSVNKEDVLLLGSEGILAGPLIDASSSQLFGMLKIEELDFMDLTVTSVETFRILCEWAGSAYAQAKKYQESLADSMHNSDTGLLSYHFCQYQQAYFETLAKEKGIGGIILKVILSNARQFNNDEKETIARVLKETVEKRVSSHILVCEGRRRNIEFILLSPGVSREGGELLVKMMQTLFSAHQAPLLKSAEFAFQTESMVRDETGRTE